MKKKNLSTDWNQGPDSASQIKLRRSIWKTLLEDSKPNFTNTACRGRILYLCQKDQGLRSDHRLLRSQQCDVVAKGANEILGCLHRNPVPRCKEVIAYCTPPVQNICNKGPHYRPTFAKAH